jgi:hypothetical protein
MADEVQVYRDANIQVTNLRAILHGKTYAMANITSVSMFTEVRSKFPGVVVGFLGVVLLLSGFGSREALGCFIVFGLVLIAVGIAYFVAQKDRYWVRIGSASGEMNALTSQNREYIERVVNAMNEAIVRRG